MVESARLALASSGCKPEALLLSYDPEMKIGLVRGLFGMVDGLEGWMVSRYGLGGSSWARTTFSCFSGKRYHSTSSRPESVPTPSSGEPKRRSRDSSSGGTRTPIVPVNSRAPYH
jgi:hypothetical protein